jgi:predicted DNA-binding transcriptional regulator AlpA
MTDNKTFDELPNDAYVRQSQLIPDPIPLSPATLWREVKAGRFPSPIKLTERCSAWRVVEVRQWMKSKNEAN